MTLDFEEYFNPLCKCEILSSEKVGTIMKIFAPGSSSSHTYHRPFSINDEIYSCFMLHDATTDNIFLLKVEGILFFHGYAELGMHCSIDRPYLVDLKVLHQFHVEKFSFRTCSPLDQRGDHAPMELYGPLTIK